MTWIIAKFYPGHKFLKNSSSDEGHKDGYTSGLKDDELGYK